MNIYFQKSFQRGFGTFPLKGDDLWNRILSSAFDETALACDRGGHETRAATCPWIVSARPIRDAGSGAAHDPVRGTEPAP